VIDTKEKIMPKKKRKYDSKKKEIKLNQQQHLFYLLFLVHQ
jgi:hypothetical protein